MKKSCHNCGGENNVITDCTYCRRNPNVEDCWISIEEGKNRLAKLEDNKSTIAQPTKPSEAEAGQKYSLNAFGGIEHDAPNSD